MAVADRCVDSDKKNRRQYNGKEYGLTADICAQEEICEFY